MNEMEMQMDMDIYSVVQDVELTHVQNNCEYFMSSSSLHLEHGLSILHINARSLMNKLDMFHTFLNNTGVKWSLICVSETWFKSHWLPFAAIDQYDLFATCRDESKGGGTAVYVHRDLSAKQRNDFTDGNSEDTFIEVQVSCEKIVKNIIVAVIYRSPSTPHLVFKHYMENTLQKLADQNKFTVVLGDFNYDLLKEASDKNVQSFYNLMSSYSYMHVITKPTRVTREHSSLLDNFFINNNNFIRSSGIITEDLSDHFPIFINLSFDLQNSKKQRVLVFLGYPGVPK